MKSLKRTYWIVGLMVMSMSFVGFAYADDYIDDVYYWPYEEKQSAPDYSVQSTDADSYSAPKISFEFIEDSITRQNPDTVVKVIIRRHYD